MFSKTADACFACVTFKFSTPFDLILRAQLVAGLQLCLECEYFICLGIQNDKSHSGRFMLSLWPSAWTVRRGLGGRLPVDNNALASLRNTTKLQSPTKLFPNKLQLATHQHF